MEDMKNFGTEYFMQTPLDLSLPVGQTFESPQKYGLGKGKRIRLFESDEEEEGPPLKHSKQQLIFQQIGGEKNETRQILTTSHSDIVVVARTAFEELSYIAEQRRLKLESLESARKEIDICDKIERRLLRLLQKKNVKK